jgi:DNA-binding beta-propeller fold protein YncE
MNPAPPVTSTRSPTRRRLRVGGPRARGVVAAGCAVAAIAVAGCGGGSSSTASTLPRAAEPAESPALRTAPAGRTTAVGREPEGVAWDAAAGLIAVGVREPSAVAFVDPKSLKVVNRVALPAPPRHLAYDASAKTVLVPAESANELVVVRPGGVVTATKVGTHPHDATSVGGDVFVADEHSDQISVLRHAHLVKTLPTPHQPGGIAAVAGRWVALVAVSARFLQVYDAHSLKPLGTVPAGVGPSHIVARGTTAYVADTQGDQILVAIYPTVRQPNSVAVDPRTGAVFVAGRDKGRLERIAPRGSKR